MATSLVSTGVQFPDATIQTTAAAGTPGATAQYSVVGPIQDQYGCIAANTSDLVLGKVYVNNFLGIYNTGAGSYKNLPREPIWSSYYSRWFCLMLTNATTYGLFSSIDGLDWKTEINAMHTAIGTSAGNILPQSDCSASLLTVDDSNGRFFFAYVSSGNLYVAYSSITSTQSIQTGNWTSVLLGTGARIGAAKYCKMSTTGASGVVVQCTNGTTGYIYTCPAGGTTFTQQLSYSTSGTNQSGYIQFQENGKIMVPIQGEPRVVYNTTGTIASGWATYNSLANQPTANLGGVFNGYMIYIAGGGLVYSTDGTTWTVATGVSGIRGITYTGSLFYAWSSQDSYISSNNIPATFSLYSGGTNLLRGLVYVSYAGRRDTAT